MEEIITFLIGVFVLILGVPIGRFLAKMTKEELKPGRKWFEVLIIISLIGGIIGLGLRNDGLMFGCFFIALVTSQSINFKQKKKKSK